MLSQATSIPDTEAVGTATTAQVLPTPNNNTGRMLTGESQYDNQAAGSGDLKRQYSPPGRVQGREDGASEQHILAIAVQFDVRRPLAQSLAARRLLTIYCNLQAQLALTHAEAVP